MTKWICPVCGYVHEGEEPPERCPQCKVPGSKFKKMEENAALQFVTEHVIGIAKDIPDTEDGKFVLQGLKDHFNGECSEVGMYLAMSRQADREGYPEIAEAFKRYAFEEADHAARFAEMLGEVVWDTKTNVEKRMLAEEGACKGKMDIATEGFEVAISQYKKDWHPLSAGIAVSRILLCRIVDEKAAWAKIPFPPKGLPRRVEQEGGIHAPGEGHRHAAQAPQGLQERAVPVQLFPCRRPVIAHPSAPPSGSPRSNP